MGQPVRAAGMAYFGRRSSPGQPRPKARGGTDGPTSPRDASPLTMVEWFGRNCGVRPTLHTVQCVERTLNARHGLAQGVIHGVVLR